MPLPNDDWYAKYGRPLAVTLGGLGGGLLGAAATPFTPFVGGAVGSGLGSAIALEGERAVRRVLGDERVGYDYSEPVKDVFKGTISDYAMQRVGAPIVKGAGKFIYNTIKGNPGRSLLGRFFSKTITPEEGLSAEYLYDVADKYKVPITPAEATGNPKLARLESKAEGSPYTGDYVTRLQMRQAQKYTDAAHEIVEKAGPRMKAKALGTQLKQALTEASQNMARLDDDAWNMLDPIVSPDTPIPLDSLKKKALEVFNKEASLPSKLRDKDLLDIAEEFSNLDVVDFRTARNIASRLNKIIRNRDISWKMNMPQYSGFGDDITYGFKNLREALANDITEVLEGINPEAVMIYQNARNTHAVYKQFFGSETFRKLMAKDPEHTIEFIFGLKSGSVPSTTRVEMIKKAVDPQTWKAMKAYFLDNYLLARNAKDVVPVDRLATMMNKYGDEYLSTVFSESELSVLRELADLGQALFTAQKMAGNPSGTGRMLAGLWAAAGWLKHPITNTTLALTQRGLTKLYFSETGRRILKDVIRTQRELLETPNLQAQQALERSIIRLIQFAGKEAIEPLEPEQSVEGAVNVQ